MHKKNDDQRPDTAIILAAGRGSRLGQLTDQKPKCLTHLANRPLLKWQQQALNECGIHHHVLVGGYRVEQLNQFSSQVLTNPQWDSTGCIHSLLQARDILNQHSTLVIYSDCLHQTSILNSLLDQPGDLVIPYDQQWHHLWQQRFQDPLSDAETFRVNHHGYLTEIGQQPQSIQEIEGQFMGLLKTTPTGWQQLLTSIQRCPFELRQQLDMTTLLQRAVNEQTNILTMPVNGGWCEVDSTEDARLYEKLTQTADWQHNWRKTLP